MPKLITTRTRTSDLGKPEIISTGEGNGGEEVMNNQKIDFYLFDLLSQPLFYYLISAYICFYKELKYNYGNALHLKWQFF